MQAPAIIPDFDIVKQRQAHLPVAAAAGVSGELGFERLKETLGRGITPTVALAGHGLGDLVGLQGVGKVRGCILGATIRAEHKPLGGSAPGAGLIPSGDCGRLGGHALGQRPAGQSSGRPGT